MFFSLMNLPRTNVLHEQRTDSRHDSIRHSKSKTEVSAVFSLTDLTVKAKLRKGQLVIQIILVTPYILGKH